MLKISPTVQLSTGLVFLTISLLLLAQVIGLAPKSGGENQLLTRQKLAETIALQTTLALKRDDRFFLESMLNQIVEETPSVQSVGLRRSNTSMIFQTPTHEKTWTLGYSAPSTINQVKIPLVINGANKAMLEMAFNELEKGGEKLFGVPKGIWLFIFICISGFTTYSIFLKRVLRHLDPNSVVPGRVRNALNTMAEGVIILDKRGQIVLVNDAMLDKFSTDEEKLIGRRASELGWTPVKNELPTTESSIELPWHIAQEKSEKQVNFRLSLELTSESSLLFSVNSVPIIDEKGKNQGTINSFDDITELEEKNNLLAQMLGDLMDKQKDIEDKNRELEHLATRDPLTGCYNRRFLFKALNTHFARETALQKEYCVIMLDIDHFKRINDTYGHGVGDDVIRAVCEKSQTVLRSEDVLARFGGEEFCILLPEMTPERAMKIAESCRELIASTPIEGVSVTSSFGVASLTFGAGTPNELVLQADQALYASKNAGRNKSTLWSKSLTKGTTTEFQLLSASRSRPADMNKT